MRLLSAVKYIISSSELEPGEQKIIDEICSLK